MNILVVDDEAVMVESIRIGLACDLETGRAKT